MHEIGHCLLGRPGVTEVADDGNTATPDPCMTLNSGSTVAPDPCDANGFDALKMPQQTVTSSWQQFTITIPNSALANIKDFFKATFIYAPTFGAPSGQGGTAYFDVILYQP